MKRCIKCRVEYSGELDRCPLCQADLMGEAEPSVFPNKTVQKSGALAMQILAFATGVCLLVMLFLWLQVSVPGNITLTVCLALVMNYLFVRNVLAHNPDFLRIIARYFFILLLVAAIWFILTGNLAITTFIIPGICLVALMFSAILVLIFRDTFVTGYAKYLLFNVAFGFIPAALVALGLTTWNLLAYISALTSGIFLLALFAFTRKEIIAEIRKLFTA